MTRFLQELNVKAIPTSIIIKAGKTIIKWDDDLTTVASPSQTDRPSWVQGVLWGLLKKFVTVPDILAYIGDNPDHQTGLLFFLLEDYMSDEIVEAVLTAAKSEMAKSQ
jgi:hypothetical protein